MRNRKRIGALILLAALCLILTVTLTFITFEADHDCCGEGCPVCRMIAANINLLQTLGLAFPALLPVVFLLNGGTAYCRHGRYIRFFSDTLVSRKVRLND